MDAKQVYKVIDAVYPFRTQARWDGSKLTPFGKKGQPVTKVLVVLDIDLRALETARERGCNLIVAHHPLFIDAVTRPVLRRARKLGISLISAHSNFDKSPVGMNHHLAHRLGLRDVRQYRGDYTFIGTLPKPLSSKDFAELAKKKLGVDSAVYFRLDDRPIRTVAVLGGAGAKHATLLGKAGIDVFVTGDVGWHGYRAAHDLGFNVLDVGHHAEQIFTEVIKDLLEKNGLSVETQLPVDRRVFY